MAKQSVSGKVKKKTGSQLDSFRYDYLSLENAEPDFGLPSANGDLLTSNTDGSRTFKSITGSNNQVEILSSSNEIQISLTDTVVVANTVQATDFNSTSDVRLKDDIQPLSNGINTINAMNPVSYIWKETQNVSYGFIAQEMENTIPAIVQTNDDGFKSISYSQIISFLVKAVQEQQEEIEELKRRLK